MVLISGRRTFEVLAELGLGWSPIGLNDTRHTRLDGVPNSSFVKPI